MTRLIHFARTLPVLMFLLGTQAFATPTLVDLAAEASRPAVNDLIRATVFAEASGRTPGDLARQVNALIADALRTARSYPSVTAQSGTTSTYPIYTKDGKIDAWRMHSELALESKDREAIAALLGTLQTSLGISNLVPQPSPETRKKVEDAAMLDALGAFKARAKVIADALGKPYRIKQISVGTNARYPQPMLRGKAMLAESAAMPVEAGESQITASVSGQIELLD